MPGCPAAAARASSGMSFVQCLPGPRKNGRTTTACAPRRTQAANAASIEAILGKSTGDLFEHHIGLMTARTMIDDDEGWGHGRFHKAYVNNRRSWRRCRVPAGEPKVAFVATAGPWGRLVPRGIQGF